MKETITTETLTEELKGLICQLEERVQATPSITILDKREFDGFTYALAVQRGENIWVVYTTRYLLRISRSLRENDSCLIAFQVTNHIPFDSVKADECGNFIDPYLNAVKDAKVRASKDLYRQLVSDLPFFQN